MISSSSAEFSPQYSQLWRPAWCSMLSRGTGVQMLPSARTTISGNGSSGAGAVNPSMAGEWMRTAVFSSGSRTHSALSPCTCLQAISRSSVAPQLK